MLSIDKLLLRLLGFSSLVFPFCFFPCSPINSSIQMLFPTCFPFEKFQNLFTLKQPTTHQILCLPRATLSFFPNIQTLLLLGKICFPPFQEFPKDYPLNCTHPLLVLNRFLVGFAPLSIFWCLFLVGSAILLFTLDICTFG